MEGGRQKKKRESWRERQGREFTKNGDGRERETEKQRKESPKREGDG